MLRSFQGITKVFPVRPSGAGRVIQRIELSAMDVRIGPGKVTLLDTLGVEQETAFYTVDAQQLFTG